MSEINTVELITKAQKGNTKAFSKLFREYEADIYRVAFIYLKNKEDALDVVQETAYRSLKSINTLKKPEYFKTWIIRIAISCAIDIIRTQKKIVPIQNYVENELISFNVSEEIPLSLTLKDLIELLDEREKAIILLRFYNNCTIKEVSEVLNIPLGTVKTILYKSLLKLRKELQGDDINER